MQSWKNREFQENVGNVWVWWSVFSRRPKSQVLMFFSKDNKKAAVNHSIEKNYFAWFCEFVYNLLYKIFWGNRFWFLTQYKPLDFIFSESFNILRDAFAFQTDIKGSSVNVKRIYFKKHYFCYLASSKILD